MFSYLVGTVKVAIDTQTNKTIYMVNKDIKYVDKELFNGLKINKSQLKKVMKFIKSDSKPDDTKLSSIYNTVKKRINDSLTNKIELKTKTMQVLPRRDLVEKLYISGISGSGKSTYTANYIKQYKKIYPDNPVCVFSSLGEDVAFDHLITERIDISNLVVDPIPFENFNDSLSIFDDTDTIKDKDELNAVNNYKAHLIECGRHIKARVIITSHIIANFNKTRQILNECTSITFFPNNNTFHIKKYLSNYLGFSKQQIERILKLPSRWVSIYNHYPSYIVYEMGIMSIKEL